MVDVEQIFLHSRHDFERERESPKLALVLIMLELNRE